MKKNQPNFLLILTFLFFHNYSFGSSHLKKMIKDSCKFPKTAIAIMNHESNYGKSKLAIKHNNLFGFKGGKFAVGKTKSGYSIYQSKIHSIRSYIEFERAIIRRYNIKNREQYLRILSKRYATDRNWLKKIRQMIV